jgi:ABC-type transport system involved in cytochrome bd biosynthesis fused ATPase/permease subunit
MKNMYFLQMLILLFLAFGCGNISDKSSQSNYSKAPEEKEEHIDLSGEIVEEKNEFLDESQYSENVTPSVKEEKVASISGTYFYRSNSVEIEIVISGDSWYGKTMIVTGLGSDYDSENAEYESGSVEGNQLYESSIMQNIGYVSGNNLITSISGRQVTLRKK